jgi:RNA processing factor Prp31
MKTFSIQVQSLNERDTFLIDSEKLIDALTEAINSFNRTHSEIASSVQAEASEVSK